MSRYLIGAGGHATVLYDIAKKNNIELNGVFIDKGTKNITPLKVIDSIENISNYSNDEFIFAFGNLKVRQKLDALLTASGIKWFTLIDKDAVICENVTLEEGTVVMPGAIINSGATVGRHSIINSGVIVEHGCRIGNHVHMSPRSVICGNSNIDDGTWIGAGSTIVDSINIGKNSIVGAGSVVIRNVPDETEVMGVPAHKKVKILK